MKLGLPSLVTALAFCLMQQSFGQGALTPPGAPTPTMKTLDQIEPRTAISSLPFTISIPGSYYLTKSLSVASSDGIRIDVSNVTLDLNGFTLSSSASSANGAGISILFGSGNITIRNGKISSGVVESGGAYSGGGFQDGISVNLTSSARIVVRDMIITGVLSNGIRVNANLSPNGTVVDSCIINTAGFIGIGADTVSNSTAMDCGFYGIDATTVENCVASVVSSDANSRAIYASNVSNSYGTATAGQGVYGNTFTNCYGTSTSNYGVNAYTVNGCYGASGSGNGIGAWIANNSQGVSNSGIGLYANYVVNGCFGQSNGAGAYGIYTQGGVYFSGGACPGGVAIHAGAGVGAYTFGGSTEIPAGSKFLGTP
ncbi:MAG: hypothetical protein ACXWG0_00350 [Chthoniobacterales bacterium]